MSKGMWWVVGIVVVALVAGYWYWGGKGSTSGYGPGAAQENAGQGSQTSVSAPSASDTSDAALNADLGAVDAQTSSFTSDNAAVSSGMNDQQVQQSSL